MDTDFTPIPVYLPVTVSISMSKEFMIEIPENTSTEDIIEKAKEEIMLPPDIIEAVNKLFNNLGLTINGIDFTPWDVDEVEYIVELFWRK